MRVLLLATLLVALVTATPASAQRIVPPPHDTLPRRPDFPAAVSETLLFELLPYGYNRWVAREPWGRTSLHTWSANLRGGWEWDTDHFTINQFAHPYSGNLYFNSARSNGYGFWTSAPFALVGSLVWEYFGETTRPSINDLVNTTLGGITLGETTYRLASLVLDGRATGAARVVREVGAGLVDPPRELARLVRGDVHRVGDDPPDETPSALASEIDVGYQRVSRGASRSPLGGPNQLFAEYVLDYGDPLGADVARPFGAFRVDATLATATAGTITDARAIGFLAAHEFEGAQRHNQRLTLVMHYDYLHNRALESGDQGVSGGLLSRWPLGARWSVRTEAWLVGYILAAVRSDLIPPSAATASDSVRGYDYGSGGGGRLVVRIDHDLHPLLDASWQSTWIDVVSGTASSHAYDVLRLRGELPVAGPFTLGASELLYRHSGRYGARGVVRGRDARTQVYVGVRM